jgi:hypothetical protein
MNPMNNVIDLAEFRKRKLMNESDGAAWLRIFVANNGLSRAERTLPPLPRRPYDAPRPSSRVNPLDVDAVPPSVQRPVGLN